MSSKVRKQDKDWLYPPNYNHLLGYVEKGKVPEGKCKKGTKVVSFDRSIKDGKNLNK